MRLNLKTIFCFCFLCLCGCASTAKQGVLPAPYQSKAQREEAVSALGTVAGAMSGQEMNEEKMKAVAKQVQKDPEAQQAVQSITDSMNPREIRLKYCPIDGHRYASEFTVCPEHKVPLENLEE